MRIRRRLVPSVSDLQPHPSDGWVSPKAQGKTEEKEFGELEEKKDVNHDGGIISKRVDTCDGEDSTNVKAISSSANQGSSDYRVVPLKKRKGSFEREEIVRMGGAKMKSKTNKKSGLKETDMLNSCNINSSTTSVAKKMKRGDVIMEGSRCSRVNGRGWRCSQPTMVGYSLCEHHLGKGRLRTVPRRQTMISSKKKTTQLSMMTLQRY